MYFYRTLDTIYFYLPIQSRYSVKSSSNGLSSFGYGFCSGLNQNYYFTVTKKSTLTKCKANIMFNGQASVVSWKLCNIHLTPSCEKNCEKNSNEILRLSFLQKKTQQKFIIIPKNFENWFFF